MDKQTKLDFRGGRRKGSGRKKIGETRRIALTLPAEDWEHIDNQEGKTAEVIRDMIQECIQKNNQGDTSGTSKPCEGN